MVTDVARKLQKTPSILILYIIYTQEGIDLLFSALRIIPITS